MESVTPSVTSSNPEEKIYETWDCPRIEVIQSYKAQDSDEVSMDQGDTANVLRKMSGSGEYQRYKAQLVNPSSKDIQIL